jgi:hypothetical protein
MGVIANAFAEAADKALEFLVSGWTHIDTPGVSGSGSSAAWLAGKVQVLTIFLATLGLVVAGARMAWERRSEPAKEAVAGILRLIVVAGAGLAALDLLLQAGDQFSVWILDQATPSGGNFGQLFKLAEASALVPALMIILAAIAMLSSLIQIFLLLIRSALIVVLGGLWPLSAAASSTPAGNAWFRKSSAWLIAFVAFKPAAAICYAAALRLTLAGDSGLAQVEGVLLLGMAVLALPALMRFAVPAVSAVGNMSAGKAAAGAAVVATGAVATVASMSAAAPAFAGASAGAASAGAGATAGGAASGGGGAGAAGAGGGPGLVGAGVGGSPGGSGAAGSAGAATPAGSGGGSNGSSGSNGAGRSNGSGGSNPKGASARDAFGGWRAANGSKPPQQDSPIEGTD